MHYYYLLALCFSIGGLLFFDLSHKNIICSHSSVIAIVASMAVLILCDIVGIHEHIFGTNLSYVSGAYLITQNLPLEEFLLLFLISYVVLLLSSHIKKV